jgi:nucleotide-binding universal stress UspA family protein
MKIKPATKRGKIIVELNPRDESILDDGRNAQTKPTPFKLKKILVPIDFSVCSKKALQYAIPLARQFGASLALLHIVQVSYPVGGEYAAVDYSLCEKEFCDLTEKQLAVLAEEEIPAGVPAATVVRRGYPVQQILEAARELEIDLIILSTHGHTGLKHVFLGSTAENVVRRAPCPVLVVREQEHEFIDNDVSRCNQQN